MPLYAIRKVGTHLVKIGVSVNVEKRCRALQLAAGAELTILHQAESTQPYHVERRLHAEYKAANRWSTYGEWYTIAETEQDDLFRRMDTLARATAPALTGNAAETADLYGWLREPLADAFAASGRTPKEFAQAAGVTVTVLRNVLERRRNLTNAAVLGIVRELGIELTASVLHAPAAVARNGAEMRDVGLAPRGFKNEEEVFWKS